MPPQRPPQEMAPQFDVAARVNEARATAQAAPAPGANTDAPEPRMITGTGPQGHRWGLGRSHDGEGGLTTRDKANLAARRAFLDKFGRENQ